MRALQPFSPTDYEAAGRFAAKYECTDPLGHVWVIAPEGEREICAHCGEERDETGRSFFIGLGNAIFIVAVAYLAVRLLVWGA